MSKEKNRVGWSWWYTALLAASVLLYLGQVALFRRPGETLFYLFQDFAFLPVQVLLVTFVLNALIARREKRRLLAKLYMVIGAFYSQVGNRLLELLLALDPEREQLGRGFLGVKSWSDAELKRLRASFAGSGQGIRPAAAELERLRSLLGAERAFLLGLVENPNLLEHESFTEVLLAVFHLTEELTYRSDLAALPPSDLAHLAGDAQRVYRLLSQEWLSYAAHLRANYPYIFSLVMRLHPFQVKPDAVVGSPTG